MRGRKDSGQKIVKNGFDKTGRQKFLDKETGKTFAEGQKPYSTIEKKITACLAYFKGMSYRSVSELFDVSHVTVYNWVNEFSDMVRVNFGEIHQNNDTTIEYEDVEIDEMFTYCQKKIVNCTSGHVSNELVDKYLRILCQRIEAKRHSKLCSK